MSSKAALEPDVIESQVPVITGLEAQTRGEIDIQIATAKRYPRSITKAVQDALTLATMSEEIAESCIFAKPTDGKMVEGPSVRLAEIMASCWGHMRSEARIVEEAERHITARGTSWDLERNVAVSFEVRRSILKRDKSRFSSDMVVTASSAANSVAYRNSVFKVIPRAVYWPIYLKCKQVAVGNAETFIGRRDKVLTHFYKMGATPERVFSALGVRGLDDVTQEHLGTLKGLNTALRDGETTLDEAFPPIVKEPQRKSQAAADTVAPASTAPASSTPTPSVAPTDAAKPATTAPPAAASVPPSTNANDHVEKGLKVLKTQWVEDGNGGFGEITTNKGVFITRDQKWFMSAASCEGADTPFLLTWRGGKLNKKGKPVDVKILVSLGLDESAPQQPALPTGEGDGNAQ